MPSHGTTLLEHRDPRETGYFPQLDFSSLEQQVVGSQTARPAAALASIYQSQFECTGKLTQVRLRLSNSPGAEEARASDRDGWSRTRRGKGAVTAREFGDTGEIRGEPVLPLEMSNVGLKHRSRGESGPLTQREKARLEREGKYTGETKDRMRHGEGSHIYPDKSEYTVRLEPPPLSPCVGPHESPPVTDIILRTADSLLRFFARRGSGRIISETAKE